VGPKGESPAVLANCYNSVLQIVKNENLKTVAFPCISTGIFGDFIIPYNIFLVTQILNLPNENRVSTFVMVSKYISNYSFLHFVPFRSQL